MWPFSRTKTSQRRHEAHRNGSSGKESLWDRFCAAGGTGAILLGLAAFLGFVALDCWPLEPLNYRVGQYVPQDIFARVTFEVESPERTKEKRDLEAKNTPAVIRLDETALQQILSDLRNLPSQLKATSQPTQLGDELRKKFDLYDPIDVANFVAFDDPARSAEYNQQLDRLRDNLLARYIVTVRDFVQACLQKQTQDVVVFDGKGQKLQPKSKLLSLEAKALDEFLAQAVSPVALSIRPNVLHYMLVVFSADGTPIYRLDGQATAAAEEAARDAVKPVTEPVRARTLLVRRTAGSDWFGKGEEGVAEGLKPAEMELLRAEHNAYLAQMRQTQPWRQWWLFGGRAGIILAIVFFLAMYIAKHHGRSDKSYTRGVGIAVVLLLALGLSKLLITVLGQNSTLAVFGIFMVTTVLTIAYDQRFAFAVAGGLVVLTVLQLREGVPQLLILWTTVGATAFQMREVRTRSKLIEVGALTAALLLVVLWAAESMQCTPGKFIFIDACYAAAAAVTGGFIAQGILPLVEKAFRVATSLTLLEWCDANKPLLKRLALEAPGTYNHCLLLGTMCEAAADAIGARGLLTRVGAYYHDIGKINKPFYFVENQPGPGSLHDKLSPAMSLLIIKGHVKDGLELAKEYGLPRVLREFIVSHHGTTLVEYFFHAAAQHRRVDVERAPDEVEFRYPGPKPQLKEAAILMMADAAESSVRAMSEPSPGRIETQVHQVIFKRLMDGQLNECDITLKEVYGVEASLIHSLCGMYHGRIKYPTQERQDRERAERLVQQEKALTGKNGHNGAAPKPHVDAQEAPAAAPADEAPVADEPHSNPTNA